MYELKLDKKAIKELNKLENTIKERIFNKILETKENPHRFFTKLKGRTDFKLRVGDYRVIAEIYDDLRLIEVTKIGHRRNIYKK